MLQKYFLNILFRNNGRKQHVLFLLHGVCALGWGARPGWARARDVGGACTWDAGLHVVEWWDGSVDGVVGGLGDVFIGLSSDMIYIYIYYLLFRVMITS
jgi:hypothetical protein